MTLHTNLSFETATGSIDYPFTNDYMFRAILQKDKQVLKALIAALLHLKKESIHDVVITNPIELGAAISDKDFILDIRVNLNNEQLIDLEMQMSNEYNWPERSISYAARSFDQLNSGEEYKEVLPVHSIDEMVEELKKYNDEDIFVIGGESIYRQLLPYCKTAYITKIDHAYQADTFFPNLDEMEEWEMTEEGDEQTCFDLEFAFTRYERR